MTATTRAARRRAERDAKKAAIPFGGKQTQFVKLSNPVADSFEAFIVGNAMVWEQMAHDALIAANYEAANSLEPYYGLAAMHATGYADPNSIENWRRFRALVEENCGDAFMLKEASKAGKHLVICGAGPSLAEHAAEYCPQADEVWGCNSAATWLIDNGHKCTHAFTVDQTAEMLVEWMAAPDVQYLLATTAHPHLVEHLRAKGRDIRWFHNYVGVKGPDMQWPDATGKHVKMLREDWLYAVLYPFTIRAGSGLNSVTRAIDVAVFMGYETITVLGADCAVRTTGPVPAGMVYGTPEHHDWLRAHTVMHADGGHAMASNASATLFDGEIDGRRWWTKADMIISAVWLVKMARRLKHLRLIGDTLPNALADKDDEYLGRLPTMVDHDDNPIQIPG